MYYTVRKPKSSLHDIQGYYTLKIHFSQEMFLFLYQVNEFFLKRPPAMELFDNELSKNNCFLTDRQEK